MNINERIREVRKHFCNDSNIVFAKKLDKGANTVSNYVRSGYSVGGNVVNDILAAFPEINSAWLLSGKGRMLKSEDMQMESTEQNSYRLVPMYNMDARGGFGNNDQVDVAEYVIDYIPFKDAKQDDICVPIIGNSMAPTYCAGSTVLLHRIEDWQEFLELGQVYMIVLKDGRRLIKELRTSQEDKKSKYLCVSHNPTFDPVELPKNMISQIFLVRAVYAKTSM